MRWLFEKNILENEFRASIYRYIKENSGAYPQKIIHDTNISRGTVFYHLNILLYTGIVEILKDGKLRKYHAARKVTV